MIKTYYITRHVIMTAYVEALDADDAIIVASDLPTHEWEFQDTTAMWVELAYPEDDDA